MEGKVALFNMWDYELNYDQLSGVNCRTIGNLLTMDGMSISGPASFSDEDVPCNQGIPVCLFSSFIKLT